MDVQRIFHIMLGFESVLKNYNSRQCNPNGENVFKDCHGLTEISIQNNIKEIDNSTFENCCSLTEITIPKSVTKIGNDAFSGCSRLKEISIPDGVTHIGTAFYGCRALKRLQFQQRN